MSSQATVLARQHRAAGDGRQRYGGLCRMREIFLGHPPKLARIIRRDPKAAAAIRDRITIGQHHSTAAAEDVEVIARRIIA